MALAVPAFPGAEGFGGNAKGARASASPTVYRVTNLNDSGAGSLRDATSASGRVIVFDVGGIIRINDPLVISSGLTIAGQTAPGGGITIYGNRVSFSGASNTICRYVRIRMGIDGDDGADAIGIASGTDMIFDHVSAAWGRDETFSISGDAAQRITLQDCLIAQGLRLHSAGGLMQTSGGVSIFRTLYADNWMRNPKVKGVNDYINNVVYNWGGGGGYIPAGDSAGDSFSNIVGCYFIAGPETGTGRSPFTSGNTNFRLHHSGNLQDLDLDGVLDGTPVTNSSFPTLELTSTRFPYPAPATEMSAPAALTWVLDRAGASHRRDRVDDYVVNEVRSHGTTGAFIYNESEMGGIGTVASGLKNPDADNDGMPDWWETAAGTNPAVADATAVGSDGYLNVERYLNALVVGGVPGASINGISTDTGASTADGITSDRTLVLSGTATAGASVAIARADLGELGTVIANGSGQWNYDYSSTSLADRVYAFTATATTGWVTTPPSPAFVVRVDAAAATPPVITSITLTPTASISGTATPGDTVVVTLSAANVGTAVADELGNWTAPYTGAALGTGVKSFTATATDLAGNTGTASTAYLVDTGLAAPVFTAISSDSGSSSSDRLTNDTTLTLSGTAPNGATVSVTRAGVGVVGSATVSSGAFSFNYTGTTLPAGTHVFTATATVSGSSSPASAPFVITVDTTAPAIASIKRSNPATYSTTGGTVVYRVTFAEPVTGVGLADFALTASGAAGTLGSLSTISTTVYDVTATGVSGDGTLRLDLDASGTGIADLAGNAISGGYTSGQTYTVRLAGSGTWLDTEDGGMWSDISNWQGGAIASGSGATADFSLRDPDVDTSLVIDSNRTLGRLVFGDIDYSSPAGWTITDNGVASRALTLGSSTTPVIQVDAATTPAGDTTDVPAAASYPHRLEVALSGTKGFTKTGVGTIELKRANPDLTGALTISKGIVQIGPGGTLAPSSVTISTSQQLRVAGGSFTTAGNVTWTSGTGTGVIVSGGTASFQNIVPSNTRNSFFRVTGGTVTGKDMNFPRSGDSESQTTGTGVLISGGDTTFENIGLGTNNSWAGMTLSGGRLAVTGILHNGYQASAGRGGVIYLSGGELAVTGATHGLVMGRNPGTNPDNVAKLLITGGVANLAKLTLGYDATVTDGTSIVSLTDGELNLGTGGIVKNGTSGLASSITLNRGTIGALASWSTAHPIVLAGSSSDSFLRAANPAGAAFDFALEGELSGTGGFAKTGGGTVTLATASTFSGAIAIDAGTLRVTGSLGAGGAVTVNSGGNLSGSGGMARAVTLQSSGKISPDGTLTANSVTWNGGGRMAARIGNTADRLVVTGGLNRGTSGSRVFELTASSPLAVGQTFTLTTFGNSNFVATDFAYTGLSGVAGVFEITGNSVVFRVTATGSMVAYESWADVHGLTGADRNQSADPEGDGLANLIEFTTGHDPKKSDPATLVPAGSIAVSGVDYPLFRYRRRTDLEGISLEVQASTGLDFTTLIPVNTVETTAGGDGTETVLIRSTVSPAGAARQFFRLNATTTGP
jgi:autotransporter-associated beta strand protein